MQRLITLCLFRKCCALLPDRSERHPGQEIFKIVLFLGCRQLWGYWLDWQQGSDWEHRANRRLRRNREHRRIRELWPDRVEHHRPYGGHRRKW